MYNSLISFGDVIGLDITIDPKQLIKEIERHDWVKYNKKKKNNRFGLSITSLNGELVGIDLDSLYEYNKEYSINIGETDCNKPTELFYKSKSLQTCLGDMLPWLCRTHFLRLGPGGFFPTHRDHKFGVQNSFRIIVPIKNCKPPYSFFLLENKLLDYLNYVPLAHAVVRVDKPNLQVTVLNLVHRGQKMLASYYIFHH